MTCPPNADCLNCPAATDGKPTSYVPFEAPKNGNPKLIIVSEYPHTREVDAKRPFLSNEGIVTTQSLKRLGQFKASYHFTYAMGCKPEGLDTKQYKKALDCCRPRLLSELKQSSCKHIMTIGKYAFRAISGSTQLEAWQGAWVNTAGDLPGYHLLPNFFPKAPAMIPVFQIFLKRAINRDNKFTWQRIHNDASQESLAALEEILAAGLPIGFDVETRGMDPLLSDLMCLGIANKNVAVSIPWVAYDAGKFGYVKGLRDYPVIGQKIETLVRNILASPTIPKVMHNAQHDLLTAQLQGIDIQGEIHDTLLLHHTIAPQIRHDLALVAAIEFPAPKWKAEFKVGTDAKGLEVFTKRDEFDLRTYNAKDAAMTILLYDKLLKRLAETHNGWEIYQDYIECSKVAMRMRKTGMLIDKKVMGDNRERLAKDAEEAKAEFEKLVEGKWQLGANGQHRGLKSLFFDTLGVEPNKFSEKTGEPVLDTATLQGAIQHKNAFISNVAKSVLTFRARTKLISTYIDGLPISPVDNRVHPTFKVYGTITGRWSSTDPNFQNLPKSMRSQFMADEGFHIVGADYSQLELRIIAILAQDTKLLDWYDAGKDVHVLTAAALFKVPVDKVSKEQRNFAKVIEYAFNYNASDDVTTVWRSAQKNFPDVTIEQLVYGRKIWFEEHPWIADWQRKMLRRAYREFYVEEPMSGRQEWFHDGRVEPNKVLNFPVQSFGGHLMNKAMIKLGKLVDWKDSFIVSQVHDAAYIMVRDIEFGKRILTEAMEQEVTLDGYTTRFPIDISVGTSLSLKE